MPETKISFVETARSRTGGRWRGVWLKKLEQACAERDLKGNTITGFRNFINGYLSPHACHPGEISLKALAEFLDQNNKSEKQAIHLILGCITNHIRIRRNQINNWRTMGLMRRVSGNKFEWSI